MRPRTPVILALLSLVTASCSANHASQPVHTHAVATTRSVHHTAARTAKSKPQNTQATSGDTVALTCAGLNKEVQRTMALVKAGSYQDALNLATKAQNDASKPNPCKDDDYAEGSARLAELDLVQSYADAKLGKNDEAMAKYEIAEGDASGCYESPALRDSAVIGHCRQLYDVLEQNHDSTMITLGNIPDALVP